LYTVSLTYLPASVANLICTLEPAMTAVLAYVVLSERLATPQWTGGALIIACVVILRIGEGRALVPSALASA
jgi:drug/metabolite transporter (DMT)-like permease